ncbi:hypothetical protein [Stenotrophomonas rhizophila]|uniref:hypothetical protein n=1 Tax=Stenotrophomonas rhizophila TaxID=216778 RepID=UPI001E31C4B9|nr:hypothetical protein [Stenotrophomonas rhizophila]MCC7634182.1 hypothetical protein [Stenotrophomonas rhizophila]MCC7662878.1 hypothetical protein [Stenotrophomonas rhizophila]
MRAVLPTIGAGIGLLLLVGLTGCAGPADAPHPVSLQEVRSIRIEYRHGPLHPVEEVYQLRPGASRRAFARRSLVAGGAQAGTADDVVPAQRVGELLWALSAPPVARERGVEAVARRVRPAQVLAQASALNAQGKLSCSAGDRPRHLRAALRGGALRRQVDGYYGPSRWSGDAPSLRVVIDYEHAPALVFHSQSQKLQMLPWTREDPVAGTNAPVTFWSVPVSQALLRLLPPSSEAARRLAAREDADLVGRIARAADAECAGSNTAATR